MNTGQDYHIITNNPRVRMKYPQITEFIDAGVAGVLVAARDRVHSGAVVITHPLSGGVSPEYCPYKSIIITNGGRGGAAGTDFASLQLIENALEKVRPPDALPLVDGGGITRDAPRVPNKNIGNIDDRTLGDFQVIDLDLIDSALGDT